VIGLAHPFLLRSFLAHALFTFHWLADPYDNEHVPQYIRVGILPGSGLILPKENVFPGTNVWNKSFSLSTERCCYDTLVAEKYWGYLGMATLWDDNMKLLIGENAQDFVSWIMKGAEVKAKLATDWQKISRI